MGKTRYKYTTTMQLTVSFETSELLHPDDQALVAATLTARELAHNYNLAADCSVCGCSGLADSHAQVCRARDAINAAGGAGNYEVHKIDPEVTEVTIVEKI